MNVLLKPLANNRGLVSLIGQGIKGTAGWLFGRALDTWNDQSRKAKLTPGRMLPEHEAHNYRVYRDAYERGEIDKATWDRIQQQFSGPNPVDGSVISFGGGDGVFGGGGDMSYRDRIADFEERMGERYDRYWDEYDNIADRVRGRSEADDAYWRKMRDTAWDTWQGDRQRVISMLNDPAYRKEVKDRQEFLRESLRGWDETFTGQRDFLNTLRDDQRALADEVRDAPSTVEEQARLQADRNLKQSIAMAGAFGGSIATDFGAFRNRAETQAGNVLRDTSVLRAREYADRINQRASLMGQAGGTAIDLANLGISNINIQDRIGSKMYDELVEDRRQNLATALALGKTGYGIATGLGLSNVGVGSTLLGRESALFGHFGRGLSFETAGDRGILGIYGGLDESDYRRMLGERNWRQMQEDRQEKRNIGVRSIIGDVGGKLFDKYIGIPQIRSQNRASGGMGRGFSNPYPKQPFELGMGGKSSIFGKY